MADYKLRRATSALYYLNPHDREVWLKAAMALKQEHGDEARYVWEEWSKKASNYCPKSAESVWRSCGNGSISMGTLFFLAKKSGWRSNGKLCPRRYEKFTHQKGEFADITKCTEEIIRPYKIWHVSKPANPNHPYLKRKAVAPYSIRQLGQALVIPLYSSDELVGLQFIHPDGSKRFLKGTRLSGSYAVIGRLNPEINCIYICEGYATGATIFAHTGVPVLCTMSSVNIKKVAIEIRLKMPSTHIVVAGDNDHMTAGNPGKKAAFEAAQAVGGEILLPQFPVGYLGSDWNDLAQLLLLEGRALKWPLN